MGWFKRIKEGITTSTNEKKETPEGLWYNCPKCKTIITAKEHKQQLYVCSNCNYHHRCSHSRTQMPLVRHVIHSLKLIMLT